MNNVITVLLIEDDIFLNSILYKHFEHKNYQVISLTMDKFDLKEINKNQFDIIIIDSDIFGSNIYNLIKDIKLVFTNTPIIVISAISQDYQLHKSLDNELYSFFSKPINLDELSQKIQFYISNKFTRV